MEASLRPSLSPAARMTLAAYAHGSFPMADDNGVHWYSPLDRAVLPLEALHVPRRLARTMARSTLAIRYDTAFAAVIDACAAPAPGREHTWIDSWIRTTFLELHTAGLAHSIEVWREDTLVGGIYGLALGAMFAGESMFHRERDASNIALVTLARDLARSGFTLFDVQYPSEHLRRFGVQTLPQEEYLRRLYQALARQPQPPWAAVPRQP